MNSKSNLSKLSRAKGHRSALMRNMVTSLVLFEHMKTTKAKAKAVVPYFDKIITIAKTKEAREARRQLESIIYDKNAVKKVLEVFRPRFEKDNSGFVKAFNIGNRKGDNAEMMMLMVKGYEYKDIGKKTKANKKKESKNEVKDSSKTEVSNIRNITETSQVKNAGQQGKAKSRSGI